MRHSLRLGIAGLGTVGGGVMKLLAREGDQLKARCGRAIEVSAVSARDQNKPRAFELGQAQWVNSPLDLAARDDVDVVVELIGGEDGIALELVQRALEAGKDVVTANKALLAHHGPALAALAEAKNCTIGYEAAVAGGIPIIKCLREGLVANRIERLYGILNGTCNYILTDMEETGREFAEVLSEAKALGYAEADPSFDVGGTDTAHKLAILAALAFGAHVPFGDLFVEGIERIRPADMEFAWDLGYRIKLLGLASREGSGVAARVHPALVPLTAPIAEVGGVMNGITVESDPVGTTVLEGPGAGEGPTASAVVADIADIARGNRQNFYVKGAKDLENAGLVPFSSLIYRYYLRLNVIDKPGVIASITAIMANAEISIESLIQPARAPDEAVPIVIQTHETTESAMASVMQQIDALDAVIEKPCLIRIEAV